ncbi:MAG: CotH kinase family protein [Verrucomicrobiia bacterium]
MFEWSRCVFECAGQTLTNVAIRYKGNSSFSMSRDSLKRPFKVDFDRGFKGRRFLGVEELSLNNNFNDSTQLKEALAYQVCREAGLPAPRTAFSRIYLTISGRVTNELLGLYTLAETVEGDFLKRHFGTKKGLLLKPERLPSLEYLGEDWNAYTNRYDPKTDAKPVETERFIALTRLIASADDATLRRELPERMDMDSLLRYLAVNALLANYDSFVGNGHNYYLFQSAEGGKAVFIPWDLNEAFGGHPPLGPRLRQAEFSVLRPLAQKNRLIERVLADPTWAAEYRRTLSNLLTHACKPGRLQAAAAQIATVTRQTVFAESPLARAMFQRTVLGATNVDLPARAPEGRPRPIRVDLEEPPLADWITVRMGNAADELAGKRKGLTPRFRPFGGPP